jgi:hypothetical protein
MGVDATFIVTHALPLIPLAAPKCLGYPLSPE